MPEAHNLKILDPLLHIRGHPEMYLGRGGAKAHTMALRLLSDVLCVTQERVTVQHYGEWWVVACEEDWMDRGSGLTAEDFFHSILPFPEMGVNAMHSEVLLTALADEVITAKRNDVMTIKGEVAQDDLLWSVLTALPPFERMVAFRGPTLAE